MTPTNASVKRIEKLLAKATPGPWVWGRIEDTAITHDGWVIHRPHSGYEFCKADLDLVIAMRNSIESLLAERKRLREALEQIADENNWGYFDESGCPKGTGQYRESWHGDKHAIDIAKKALSERGDE